MDAPWLVCGVILFLMINVCSIPSTFAQRNECDSGAEGKGDRRQIKLGEGTPENIKETFLKKCKTWDRNNGPSSKCRRGMTQRLKRRILRFESIWHHDKCNDLWKLFYDSFAYKDTCDTNYDYTKLCEAGIRNPKGKNQILLYSGVSNISRNNARKNGYTTIEDTQMGFTLDETEHWCGTTERHGINYKACPNRNNCEENYKHAWCAFWQAASEKFAKDAIGTVHILLNGSKADGKVVINRSFLLRYEVGNLDKSKVTKVQILMIYNRDKKPTDKGCNDISVKRLMIKLRKELEKIEVECTDYETFKRLRIKHDVNHISRSSAFLVGVDSTWILVSAILLTFSKVTYF
ncbi:ADP-ribosyl cyclase/cyclic ADP-ribose hydrolase-like [Ptychodera flava]|uniref:ADP-ribosyl cyclase/cyclic ADP-ribose hydrolase-like n=1 Tax=Ptychodera flava TaxID=63121 RepID=UPI00396A03F9